MNTIQLIWLVCIGVIMTGMLVLFFITLNIHPFRFLKKHNIIGLEHYDCLFDDDDCDE